MFLLNGKPLSPDNAFKTEVSIAVNVPVVIELIDGIETITQAAETIYEIQTIQYPANWLRLSTQSEREAIGITEVADPVAYDDRFYWSADNPKALEDETITPEGGTPYVQKGLKSNWVAQIKDTAGKLLAATDWMIIRKAERGTEIPTSVISYRAAIVTECNRLETAINKTKKIDAFIIVVTTQNWTTNE